MDGWREIKYKLDCKMTKAEKKTHLLSVHCFIMLRIKEQSHFSFNNSFLLCCRTSLFPLHFIPHLFVPLILPLVRPFLVLYFTLVFFALLGFSSPVHTYYFIWYVFIIHITENMAQVIFIFNLLKRKYHQFHIPAGLVLAFWGFGFVFEFIFFWNIFGYEIKSTE